MCENLTEFRKSSIFDSTVGRDLYRRGSGIVMRRPLVLQLHKTKEGELDYSEFLHLSKHHFVDYCIFFYQKSDSSWKKSTTNYITASYLQLILLWTAAILVCRTLDPVLMPYESSHVVKQRLLNL